MVVQHNMQAMNASRMLNITSNAQSKSTEKLSSGYRINRAADDAAGLSISEKMRKQIRGLDQASTNAQDGVSAVQTAEGALTEVHSMLQRMNELAVQAANGTNSTTDRQSIQDEIDQLTTEIDRVAVTTKFNETYLLKGDGSKFDHLVNAHDAGIEGTLTDNGATASFKVDSELNDGDTIKIAGKEYTIGSGEEKSVSDFAAKGATNWGTTAGTVGAKPVSAGDSFYVKSTGTTYTLADKITINSDGEVNGGDKTLVTGDTISITDANGNTQTYTVKGATSLVDDEVKAGDAGILVAQALDAGHSVSYTSTNTGGTYEVVDKLTEETGGTYEVSSLDASGDTFKKVDTVNALLTKAGKTAATVAEGDSVTINGDTITATDNKPMSSENITSIINKMQAGDQMIIKSDSKAADGNGTASVITIEDATDAVNNKYTVADALKLVGTNDDVEFLINGNNTAAVNAATAAGLEQAENKTTAGAITNTVMGSTTGVAAADVNGDLYSFGAVTSVGDLSSSDSDTITKADALEKIATELQKASSIGTDTAATVKNNGDGSFEITKGSVEYKDALSFNLHVGADADMTNKITVNINEMSSSYLGVKGLNVNDDSGMAATYAIDAIADAVSKVSTQRSALGAIQNRLEHTIANVDNVVENTTAAESRIRDTDMADEMVTYSKNNILAQAGQAMLAQANQSTQGVLSILG